MLKKIKEISRSFYYAGRGLVYVVKNERNFQIELLAAYGVFILAIWWRVTRWEAVVLVLTVGLVLILEILNTALERVVNILKPGVHPWAKVVKDSLAAAVFLSCLVAIIIGIFIFWPYFFSVEIFGFKNGE